MSNRTQTPRGRQPEWNAPLVSLPDISQIINGDTDVTQPIAVSVSGSGGPNQRSAEPIAEPAIAAAELVPSSKNETSSAEYSPILVAKNPSAMQTLRTVEAPERPADPSPVPHAHSIPTVADDVGSGETDSKSVESAEHVEQVANEADSDKPAGRDRKKMWTNVLISVGSVAATVAILSAFTGDKPKDVDAAANASRRPLHDEPLDDAAGKIPVVELEAVTAEPLNPTTPTTSNSENTSTVVAESEFPLEKDEPISGGNDYGATALVSNEPPTSGDFATFDANPLTTETSNVVPTDAISQNDRQVSPYGDAGPTGNATATDQSEFRHIQRYQPSDSIWQPPAQSDLQIQNATAPFGKSFASADPTRGHVRNDLSPERNKPEATDDKPYYERTSPDRYLWPEGANARAIEFLSKRTRR